MLTCPSVKRKTLVLNVGGYIQARVRVGYYLSSPPLFEPKSLGEFLCLLRTKIHRAGSVHGVKSDLRILGICTAYVVAVEKPFPADQSSFSAKPATFDYSKTGNLFGKA